MIFLNKKTSVSASATLAPSSERCYIKQGLFNLGHCGPLDLNIIFGLFKQQHNLTAN